MTDSDSIPPDNLLDLSTAAKRKKAKSKSQKSRAKGTTLCASGFHKWQTDPKKQFDVRQGKLISIERCRRCGTTRTLVG